MQEPDLSAVSTNKISIPLFIEKGIEVSVLRLDNIHPVISGNKFFKLRFYLEEARNTGKDHIITYGGAWSNHIVATAAACRQQGFRCTGYIRGEKPVILSPTLNEAMLHGMELIFLSREEFSAQKRNSASTQGNSFIIPEGGYGKTGAKGAATILNCMAPETYTHICCAAGTGTMAAGLLTGSAGLQKIVCISVLKNNLSLHTDIMALAGEYGHAAIINHDYHFGGYAKHNATLISFMNDFYQQTGIPSDFVYTAKLFYAVCDMIKEDLFAPGSNLLLIHSGGLQGNNSLNKGTLIF